MHGLKQKRLLGTHVKVILLAWLSMIGFDIFLHAGKVLTFVRGTFVVTVILQTIVVAPAVPR